MPYANGDEAHKPFLYLTFLNCSHLLVSSLASAAEITIRDKQLRRLCRLRMTLRDRITVPKAGFTQAVSLDSRIAALWYVVQSAGAAVAWLVDTHKMSLMSQLVVNWGLMTVSYPLLALLVFLAVKDEDSSVSSVEDGKDTKLSAPTSLH